MTEQTLRDLYGLDSNARPSGWLPTVLGFVLRHSAAVVASVLGLTVACGILAAQLGLVTDFAQLIPDDTRSVVEQRQGERYLGNTSLLVVVIRTRADRGGGPGEDAGSRARQAARSLSEALSGDPEFDFVLHRFDRAFFERNALLYLTKDQLEDLEQRLDRRIRAEVLRANPLFVPLDEDLDSDPDGAGADNPGQGEPDIFDPETFRQLYFKDRNDLETGEYLVDSTGTTYLVLARPIRPPVDINYNKSILRRVGDHVAALKLDDRYGPGLEIEFSGNYWTTTEENDAVKRDLANAGLLSSALLLAVVLFYFRRVRAVWIIFIPLVSGVVVMMGYVKLAVGQLNTVTGFCFALFMGLSIDFAIHLLARYDEERGRGCSVFDALLTTYRETGRASVLAAVTSSVGFLSLVAGDFEGFRDFGIIAGGGIMICLAVIAVLFPAVIALSLRFVREARFAGFDLGLASQQRRPRYARATVLIGAAVLCLLAWRAGYLEWEDDFRNLRGGSERNLETADLVRQILGRSTQPAVRITDSLAEAAALTRACNSEREARAERTTVELCLSLADFLPVDQAAKLPIIAGIVGLLSDKRLDAIDDDERRAKLRELRDQAPRAPLTEADLPAEIVASFVGISGDKYLMKAYPADSTWLASNNIRFAEELSAGDGVSDSDIGPIGSAMIMADLMRVMKRDSLVIVTIALLAVFAVLVVLFRSATKAMACYAPLLLSLSATVGLMQLLDMRLGLFNMIVLPSLIGIGVDNNVHLFHRYQLEGRGSWPYTIKTTGVACLMAAVTTMAGFAGLILAGHRGLNTIGDLAILGIVTATVVSLVFLPAAIALVEWRFKGTCFGVFPDHEFDGGKRHTR
ncbi:MAG: MMPL family transporter [Proteobacteria bacterium]|nr:MMPL family transporter [Pseudomonadota bacterium]